MMAGRIGRRGLATRLKSQKSYQINATLLCLGMVTLALALFRIFRWDQFLYVLYNSDTLYLINLIDAVKNDSLSSLQFSHLPSVFPDGLVICLLMTMGAPFSIAYKLYAAGSLLVLFAAAMGIIREIARSACAVGYCMLLCFVVVLSLFVPFIYVLAQTLIVGVHGGALILSVVSSYWAWRYLSSADHPRKFLWAIAVSIGIGTFSDVILVLQFVLPNIAASLFVTSLRRQLSAAAAKLNAAAIGAAALGYTAFEFLPTTPFPPSTLQSLTQNAALFWSHVDTPLALISLLPSLMLAYLSAVMFFGRFLPMTRVPKAAGEIAFEARTYFLVFGTAAALIGDALVAVAYQDAYTFRYNLPAVWWPVILGAALLPVRGRITVKPIVPLFVLLLLSLAATVRAHEARPFWTDTLVHCLEAMNQTVPLDDGLADYWIAHPVTEFSRRRYVMGQVDQAGDPFMWLNNRHDFFADKAGRTLRNYNFFIEKAADTSGIETRFGPASSRKSCGEYEIIYYADNSKIQSRLAEWFRHNP